MTDKSQSQQVSNIFSLIRLKAQCRVIPTRVDFSTPNKSLSSQSSITPSFLNDRCYYTPSFTLPIEFKNYQQNLAAQKCQFEENIQRSLQEDSHFGLSASRQDLDAVAPHSKYCQICQQRFDDYFNHILLKSHENRMTRSEASENIRKLCEQFQAQIVARKVKGTTKRIKKQQKIQEKKLKEKKVNRLKGGQNESNEGTITKQNHSTGIIEDTTA